MVRGDVVQYSFYSLNQNNIIIDLNLIVFTWFPSTFALTLIGASVDAITRVQFSATIAKINGLISAVV